MTRPLWHCHVAISLDGKIARRDGSFDWLYAYPPQDFGIDAYHAAIGCLVMGRATYETERAMEPWLHAGRRVFVVTSKPLANPPPLVEAWQGSLEELTRMLDGGCFGRIGIEGGGQLIRGLVEIGRLDVLEMAIVPLVLGDGIPLFPAGTRELPLRLAKCEPKTGGALHVVYERP
jgi:dihydrofolate reductase